MATVQLSENEMIKREIAQEFEENIYPTEILNVISKYNKKILSPGNVSKVKAKTSADGRHEGARQLLDCLACYQDWFPCLLKVLKDDSVCQSDLAENWDRKVKAMLAQNRSTPRGPVNPSGATNDTMQIHLGRNKYLIKNYFKTEQRIHIREYEESGQLKPTQRGVTFTLLKWRNFQDLVGTIDKFVEEVRKTSEGRHTWLIADYWFVTVNSKYPGVYFRQRKYQNKRQRRPICTAVHISYKEWQILKTQAEFITGTVND